MSQYERSDLHREADHMTREARAQAEATANELKAETRNLGDEAKAAVSDVTSQARQAKDTVVSEVTGAISSAKQEIVGRVEAQKTEIADRIGGLAETVHASAEDLRGREAWLADLMDRGAQELGGFAEALKNRDLGSIVGSVESFARRQPALFLGITVAVGFGLARLARSSAERRIEPSYGQPTYTPPQPVYTPPPSTYPATGGYSPATGPGYGSGSPTGYPLSGQPSTVELDRGESVGEAARRPGGLSNDPVSGSTY